MSEPLFDFDPALDGGLYLTYKGGPVFWALPDAEWSDVLGELTRLLNKYVPSESRSHIIRDWNGGDAPYLIG